MSGFSYDNRGMGTGSGRLYVAFAVWLVLVIVGALCTWYGWLGPGSEGSQQDVAQPTQPGGAAVPTQVAAAPTQAAGAAPAATATQSSSDAPSPTLSTAGEVYGYGVALNGTGGIDLIDYWMGQVKSLGLGWAKQQVDWKTYEGNPGEMDWSGYDAVVDAANSQGLRVMLSVVKAPLWSRTYFSDGPGSLTNNAPPDDLSKYAEFIGRLVDRYQGRIHAIEVWNEQNLDREWDTAEGVNAERYVEMLRLAYQAIKSRDPNIIVISGALSPTGANLNEPCADCPGGVRLLTMDDFGYMDRMIAAGLLNYCDCVGAHHNGINVPPTADCDGSYLDASATFRGYWDSPHPSWCFKTTLEGYHQRIVNAGSSTPLCVTEFGWATAEGFDGYPAGFEFALDNTLQEQAQWDVEAFQTMRQWGFVRLAFLWNLNYSQLGSGPQDPNAPYAIIDFSGVARPAFEAIRAMEKP